MIIIAGHELVAAEQRDTFVADIDAVSKALGHSSVAITSLIYTALFNAARAQMATKAEPWYGRTGPLQPARSFTTQDP